MVAVERQPSAKCPERDLWRHVPKQFARAANGGDINHVLKFTALGLQYEHVTGLPQRWVLVTEFPSASAVRSSECLILLPPQG